MQRHQRSAGPLRLLRDACFFIALSHLSILAVAQNLSVEVATLLRIKASLGSADNIILSTWSANNPLCAWRNVHWIFKNGSSLDCSRASNNLTLSQDPEIAVYNISLAAGGLNGSLPDGSIPSDLGNSASLAFLYLGENQLNGTIPPSLWNLCGKLVELHLDNNRLSGTIPSPAEPNAVCPQLETLDLNNNFLDGSIPSFLGTFGNLKYLDLSNNTLSGTIPTNLTQLRKLSNLNLAYNNLSGPVPAFAENITVNSFLGNPSLCGSPLTVSCVQTSVAPKRTGLSPRLVAGLVIGVLAAAVSILALLIAFGHKHNWGMKDREVAATLRRELEDDDIGDGKLFRFEGGEHLTVEEVLNAPGEVLGKTAYGTVYKAKLTNGGMIALRLLREDTVKERELFASAIQELGLIRHPNLVSVLAYYAGSKGEKLLVYNYLSRGSLTDLLYNKTTARLPLGWARRHKIALGAARGLSHLHHGLHTRIIHGNLKSKNIIVDENYEGHLADYGLDRLMNSAAQNQMVKTAASQGYKAPELQKMSRANAKTDVYSFGIVLLEILTGKKPGDVEGSEKSVDLPKIVKSAVLEERVSEVFDLEIMAGMRSPLEDGLLQALQLAMGCCAPSPDIRPDMKEVVRQLEEIRPKIPTPLYTPTGMKSPRDFTS